MSRFHTGKNDRSWINDHKRTADKLQRHASIMADLISRGWDRETASKEAYRQVTTPIVIVGTRGPVECEVAALAGGGQ